MNIRSATPDDVAALAAIDLTAKRVAMPMIAWPRSEKPGRIAAALLSGERAGRAFYEHHGFVVEALGDGSKNEEGRRIFFKFGVTRNQAKRESPMLCRIC